MVHVEFLGPIGLDTMHIEASTLQELKVALKKVPQLHAWLENSAVAVNDVLINDIHTRLNDGDRISILPPVCGG